MNQRTKSFVYLVAALALPGGARAQVPGPEQIEVLQASEGPRVLLAGVGPGAAYGRAVERLGATGLEDEPFDSAGSFVKMGEIDGIECGLGVMMDPFERVEELRIVCDGRPSELQRLADRFRAVLSMLPSRESGGAVWFGDPRAVVGIRIEPVDDDSGWWRTFGPWRLQVGFRG